MLKGERIYLRLIRKLDIDRLYNLCNEDEVNKYNNILPDKKYLLNNFYIIKRIPNKILSIINEKNVVIGFIDYRSYNSLVYAVGISIGKKFWGRGYGQESIKVLSNYLFKDLEAKEIIVEVIDKNIRAIKCYKACGFFIEEAADGYNRSNIIKMILKRK